MYNDATAREPKLGLKDVASWAKACLLRAVAAVGYVGQV
jgi:hypothetical protein